jgi:multiple sugar transport system ATP-binding protein
MASLQFENVNKYYYSSKTLVHAVQDLNLDVADGEIVSILGPSGCGKSSTMRMIAGLEQITEGTISFDKVRVNDMSPAERKVALAFESYALYQHFTVRENIAYCLKCDRSAKADIEKTVSWISELFGIQGILDMKPSQLSGGQQQLVSLARALVRRPSVTLLDEPISHLDTQTRLAISLKIRQIHNATGLTMVYVTHNQEEALAIADRIMVMNYGAMQQVGDRIEIIKKPKNLFVAGFVGEPSMNFIRCEVSRGPGGGMQARSADGAFTVEVDRKVSSHVTASGGKELVIGLRPIDMHLRPLGEGFPVLSGTVGYFEFLGEKANVKVALGKDTTVLAVVDPEVDAKKGDPFSLYYDPSSLHFFDPQTQERIEN